MPGVASVTAPEHPGFVLDGHLRRLASRKTHCRTALGKLAAAFLRRGAHHRVNAFPARRLLPARAPRHVGAEGARARGPRPEGLARARARRCAPEWRALVGSRARHPPGRRRADRCCMDRASARRHSASARRRGGARVGRFRGRLPGARLGRRALPGRDRRVCRAGRGSLARTRAAPPPREAGESQPRHRDPSSPATAGGAPAALHVATEGTSTTTTSSSGRAAGRTRRTTGSPSARGTTFAGCMRGACAPGARRRTGSRGSSGFVPTGRRCCASAATATCALTQWRLSG
jgi:hypothetical protein